MSTSDAGRLTVLGMPDQIHPEGMSLQALATAARRLDALSCARVVGNAADAVHAAHKAGQPLGALSPTAIIVRGDGSVVLTGGPALTGYTAPERLRGGAGDRRSEVFALGAILWEALVGERLFDGADDAAIERAVIEAQFVAPSELNANVPAELDAICRKALAAEPADRYPSTKVMAAEIDALLGDAGYPETNEQLVAAVARARSPQHASRPTASLSAQGVGAASASTSGAAAASGSPATHARTAPLPGALVPPSKTLPPPFRERVGAQTMLGAHSPAEPVLLPPAAQPIALPGPSPRADQPAATAILGSNAIAAIPGSHPIIDHPPAPPPAPAPAPAPIAAPPREAPPYRSPGASAEAAPYRAPSVTETPSYAPPAMPAPLPEPMSTTQVTGPPAMTPPPMAMLARPPGITITPTTPAAVLQTADDAFTDEHHADPAEVAAKHFAERASSRDMLGGWGWTTGASAIVDDHDHHDEIARASRRRLVIAVGGALGVAAVIVAVALAFGGSKPDAKLAATPARPAAAAPTAPVPTAPAATPPPASVAAATPPPAPEAAAPQPVVVEAVPPAAPQAAPPAEPVTPARPAPAKPEPAKLVATAKPAARVEPPRKPEKKLDPRPADKAKRAQIARPSGRAQPLDPYAAAEKPRFDAAAAYRQGLQQFARGETTAALLTFRGSLANVPNFAPTWRGLGLVYEKQGNRGQARSAFRRYLQLSPTAPDAEQIRERVERLGQ